MLRQSASNLSRLLKRGLLRSPRLRSTVVIGRSSVRVIREAILETAHYLNWAGLAESDRGIKGSVENRRAEIMKDTHKIEKGLAISSTKRPFGAQVSAKIMSNLETEENVPPSIRVPADEALVALDLWNSEATKDLSVVLPVSDGEHGSCDRAMNHSEFLRDRHSTRHFDRKRPVEDEIIVEAARIAQNAPSVCNRQAGRLHFYRDEQAQSLLALQNGNHTFRSEIGTIAIVTVESQCFLGAYERRQLGIDGGIFALQTALAFHSLGVGSCFLNWDMPEKDSRKLRVAGGIPDSESIVCFLALGYADPSALIARSSRRDIGEILTIH